VAPAERAFGESLTQLGLVATLVLVAAWVGADLLVRRDLDANKALVRRLYDAFETGGVDPLDEVVAPDFVDHDPLPGQAPGLVGMKQAVGLFRAAFPDGRLAVEELIAEGDKVVARVRLSGTQVGAFAGAEPTGRPMTAEGVETYRVARGKIVEGWSHFGPLAPVPDPADRPETSAEVEAHIA
jgi:predicted ester cyclase